MRENSHPAKPLQIGWVLLISFVVFCVGYPVAEAFRWSDRLAGFQNGAFHAAAILAFVWFIFVAPWSFIVLRLYRGRRAVRHRTGWILAPAILMFIMSVGGLIIDPPSAENDFVVSRALSCPQTSRICVFISAAEG